MKPSLVVIGLGNPGASYERTRHNAGFLAIDALSKECGQGEWKDVAKFQALTQEARIVTVPVLLVKPLTFMNLSGQSIRKIVDFYKLDASKQILVCCDEIDIPLGTYRLKHQGSPGTHNGLKSVAEQFGEAYPRLRIGVGPKPAGADLANWVLSTPSPADWKQLTGVIASLPQAVKEFVMDGRTGED